MVRSRERGRSKELASRVDEVLLTEQLGSRPARQRNYIAEHSAFVTLAREMSASSRSFTQCLCDLALELCNAGSAGISLLSREDGTEALRWIALSGAYATYVDGTTPRDFSPCGTCLDRGSPQLFSYPERYFTYFAKVEPPIVEGLVVPFRAHGLDLGTIWVVSHDDSHRGFDAEDARVLESFGNFAAAALQQVHLRENISESELGLRRMLDAFGLPVYATDAEGLILQYNEQAAALWGRRPEVGKDMWCGSWRIFSTEGAPVPLDACPMAITLRENRPIHDEEIIVERPDGSRRRIRPYPSPLRDESGKLVGAVNILLDVTDQRRGEEALARLAAIVTSSQDAIVAKDLNGIVTAWNSGAESMFGYSAAEAVGQSIRLIIPNYRQDEEDRVLESIRRGERVEHFETVRRRKDGTEIPISLTVSPVKTASGQIIGASKIARDISERKKAEAALRQAQEMKDHFLSLISHELRNPLSTILGNGILLRRRAQQQDEADVIQGLDDIVSSARKLDSYVENLLIFQRLESGQLELDLLSLPALAVKGIQTFQTENPARTIRFNSPEDVKPCFGQEALVSLVIQNLLANANKYSPPETEIDVSVVANDNGDPELHVIDRGIGLNKEDMASIFTPFYRSKKARAQASGMGLGLAVCKRAMEALGGYIRVQSRVEGSDFYVCLKAAEAD